MKRSPPWTCGTDSFETFLNGQMLGLRAEVSRRSPCVTNGRGDGALAPDFRPLPRCGRVAAVEEVIFQKRSLVGRKATTLARPAAVVRDANHGYAAADRRCLDHNTPPRLEHSRGT